VLSKDTTANIQGVANIKRLGPLQKRIILWLADREETILSGNDNRVKNDLRTKGIPWRTSAIYGDEQSKMPKSARINAKKARDRLEARDLIQTFRSRSSEGKARRVSHVKLTQHGYLLALRLLLQTNKRLPESILRASLEDLSSNINQLEYVGHSISRLMKAVSTEGAQISITVDSNELSLSIDQLDQILNLAAEARSDRIKELKQTKRLFEKRK
jgi:hypothetical protein